MNIPKLDLDGDARLLVLTGAGVSAESGVPTFRGAGGLWGTYRFDEVASPRAFASDPALVWRFYSERRAGAATVSPNAGHEALARVEERLGDRFLLATQNVDGLHTRAGSKRVVEMHGALFRSRCSSCDLPPFDDDKLYEAAPLPRCPACSARGYEALLRPDIVWFGEQLDGRDLARIDSFVRESGRLFFLCVGSSGAVYPAAGIVDVVKDLGAETWLVNAEPADNTGSFDTFLEGKAGEILPTLLGV